MLRPSPPRQPEKPQQVPAPLNEPSAPAGVHNFSSHPIQLRNWPHAPAHHLRDAGTYIVTAGTYHHIPVFHGPDRLTFLTNHILELAQRYEWRLQAWAIFPNHYHLIGQSQKPQSLRSFVRHLHSITAIEANRLDHAPGRKVWFEYWETRITFPRSYFVRLNYIHQNAIHHGLVKVAAQYPWCSAGWFERTARPPFYRTVSSFNTDHLNVPDNFAVPTVE
jgi:putative transposase